MKKIIRRIQKILSGEKGMTLTEVLVAMTIFVIAAAVAFVIYNLSRETFRKGELAATQQQNTRVAFDELTSDIRLAGYNTNPAGMRNLPDEQIEGAWDTIISVRGDYDYEDPTLRTTPESTLTGTYNVVSTGNDEIVTYALGKEGGTGGSTITISADVKDSTRDGTVETVNIPNVALTQDDPPYVLYRITLNNSYATYGSSGFIIRQPVADNIKSMKFKYYDQNNLLMTAPGGAESAKETRATIRRIEVDLVGMTEAPDLKWEDPNDPDVKTKKFRKFELVQDIIPRNLGLYGVPDIDLTPPSTPTGVALCAGHCSGMLVKWNPNNPNEIVDRYLVKYGLSPSSMNDLIESTSTFIFVPNLSNNTVYYFAVAAVDASGNRSAYSTTISGTVKDDVSPTRTIPAGVDPATLTVTGHSPADGLIGKIVLNWTAVTQNANALACDPSSPMIRDLKGYRLYRDTSSSYPPDLSHQYKDENVLQAAANPEYTDLSVVNCKNYYYNITAVDKCGNESTAFASPIQGKSTSTIKPKKPLNVNCTRLSSSRVHIVWDAVTQDVADPPNTIYIENYKVFRSKVPVGSDPWTATYTHIGNSATIEFYDNSVDPESNEWEFYYRVTALDDCPNESEMSDPAKASCPFDGTISIDPPDGSVMAPGTYTVTVSVVGADTYTLCTLQIVDSHNLMVYDQTATGGPPYVYSWGVTVADNYTATAMIENANGCFKAKSVVYQVVPSVPCQITAADPIYNPTKGPSKNNAVYWKIANSSGKDLQIFKLEIRLQEDRTQNGKKLLKIYYPWVIGLEYDQQPAENIVYTSTAGDALPATVSFNNDPRTPLPLGLSQTALNPLPMGLLFDKTLISGQLKDIVGVKYTFRYAGEPSQGFCDLTVEPTTAP